MENFDLKYIKKHYGEHFAHLCRSSFPLILEKKGKLLEIIACPWAHPESPAYARYAKVRSSRSASAYKPRTCE